MVRKHTFYVFIFFKFVKVCFMTQDMVYFYNVSCALEKNVYSAVLGSRGLKITIKSIWLMVVLGIVCPY